MALHGSLKQFEGLFEFLSGLNRESTSEGYLGLVKIKHLNSLKSDFRFEVEIWRKKNCLNHQKDAVRRSSLAENCPIMLSKLNLVLYLSNVERVEITWKDMDMETYIQED